MAASVLWTFAHRALAPQFHEDPARFVEILEGNRAPAYLEHLWNWSLQATAQTTPAEPPLKYDVDRPRDGLAIVAFEFRDVVHTGEPWRARFIVRTPDADGTNGYARAFYLEHNEYATEIDGKPTAIVCEPERGGRHRNWGTTMAPTDEQGFDRFVIATLQAKT